MQPSSRLVVSPDGRNLQVVLEVVMRPEEDVPVESRVTYEAQRYRVVSSVLMPDDFRGSHRELQLTRLG